MPDRPIFFAHVPRSGGTSLVTWIRKTLGPAEVFPSGEPMEALAGKMFPGGLRDLDDDAKDAIRLYAPHLPLATSDVIDRPVELATVVRDPWEQLRSSVGLTLGSEPTGEFAEAVAGLDHPWYVTHQLRWYLGASADDVFDVHELAARLDGDSILERLDRAMVDVLGDVDLVSAACDRLRSIGLLGATADLAGFMQRVGRHLGIEPDRDAPWLNRGPQRSSIGPPDAAVREMIRGEYDVFDEAVDLLEG